MKIQYSFDALISKVIFWGQNRDLLKPENAQAQMLKVMEEVGETARAILKKDRAGVQDGIGDAFVTLIILAMQNDLVPRECLQAAWQEIQFRTGKTVDGTFIKEEK